MAIDFNFIQILLVGLVAFIAGIDQFSFLESLQRPIVLGPIVGAILGDFDMGLKIGASYELIMIGSMPIGGAQPPNAVLGGIMAVVFAISLNSPDFEAALALAVPFGLLGQQAVNIWFTVSSPVMSKMDSLAAKADVKAIERLNWVMCIGIGILFAIIAMIGTYAGAAIGDFLSTVVPTWVWNGLGAGGGMMKFVGFAVLMKVMISGEFWTILFAGFAFATVIDASFGKGSYTLVIIAIIGGAMAYYDYQLNTKFKQNGSVTKEDYSDGI